MEDVNKGADELGKAMQDHPQKANEVEGKAKDALGQHTSQGTADEAVNKGSEFLENRGKGQNS